MTDTTSARKFSGTQLLTVFLSVSSAAAIVLALLGYGVALSVETKFGIPHAVVFNSTSDLLTLGSWAVMQMLGYLSKLSEWGFYAEIWEMSWPATKIALIVAVAILLVGALALAVPALLRRWTGLSGAVKQARGFASAHRRVAVIVGVPLFILGTPLVVMPLASLVVLVGLVLLACFLSIIPIAGLQAGSTHIDDWVVGPTVCTPLIGRDARLQSKPVSAQRGGTKIKATTCVSVKKSEGQEHRGRVVFATFNAVVLYDPATGAVRRVSTDGASIEVIDKL
ncbi:hypothetical protein SAMN05518854_11283 [Variovorax sp. YR266]|uniref:hypothetical protein n=1 Tax=Variovorax sp. YR266 TaxID=1884386 RepID=UPI00089D67E8|nr:hypothetical protein [Variovorax sp. YR266]SDZ69499.1 hypothetical protein SAMN05518854_11283 [Variovorax sp. YR266]